MIASSVLFILSFLYNIHQIQSLDNNNFSNDLCINTTSGLFQGKQVRIENVFIKQFFGIPYGEKPLRFQLPILRQYNPKSITYATKRTAGCLQTSGGLSYGPFQSSDMYDEDCLTLNIFIPKSKSAKPKAIMVYCHGGSNQIDSGSSFDGSAIAAIGDVIVITINYRLNILGFLTPDKDIMSGNYGLYDQLLALKWISLNAKNFNGDSKRITYVGYSSGAVNVLLLAMSKHSERLINRVIAQSGCPLNKWAIDRQPKIRFDNVIKRNGMKTNKNLIQSNIQQLKNLSSQDFQYMYHSDLEIFPDYPYPTIDDDIILANLEEQIHKGPLVNVDIMIGVTSNEALDFAKKYLFYNYLSRKYRQNPSSIIKKYLQVNYPDHLCYYDEIQERYMPKAIQQHDILQITHHYTNLLNDVLFYYDLVRFLHHRLSSQSSSTYVYYYTYPENRVGYATELDLIWGLPFFNRTQKNISYIPDEINLSRRMIRYWTNFAKTGNPNEPIDTSIHWPLYEQTKKSYINLRTDQIRIENDFLEERFHFWNMILHRQKCLPFRWYQTCLLIGILILAILLILIYIFYSSKRSRRNIKPTELTTTHIVTTYHFLPTVVS